MQRWDIIQKLIDENNFKSYCEVGVFHSWNWDRINCEEKTAVDPDKGIPIPKGGEFYNITSDEFFETLPKDKKFQIFFLDGLHAADQIQRDIDNSLKHLTEGGKIVIHDCLPFLEEHTTTGDEFGNWTGTVYRTAVDYTFKGDFDLTILNTDWGVGIIDTKKPNLNRVMGEFDAALSWRQYLNWKDNNYSWKFFDSNKFNLLNIVEPHDFH